MEDRPDSGTTRDRGETENTEAKNLREWTDYKRFHEGTAGGGEESLGMRYENFDIGPR